MSLSCDFQNKDSVLETGLEAQSEALAQSGLDSELGQLSFQD